MKKKAMVIGGLLLTVGLLTSCANEKVSQFSLKRSIPDAAEVLAATEDSEDEETVTTKTKTVVEEEAIDSFLKMGTKNEFDKSQIEIVCWGDSMTEGGGVSEAEIHTEDKEFDASYLSYPESLEKLTGITTYNFGVGGATSEEIAIMQGAIEPSKDLDDYNRINYEVMEESKEHKGDILILEIGSNGGWDGIYENLIEQYDAMIEYADCDKYIIIGDTDDPGTSLADLSQGTTNPDGTYIGTDDTYWEAALREAYGEHFINMRAYLVKYGLEVTGLTATKEDVKAQEQGVISTQLRADWTHLNSYGYYAQALGIYEKGIELGYWY